MIIQGKSTSAEIFTDNIEESALEWLTQLCDHPAMEGVDIVQMPDVHAGNLCNVGTAYPIGSYVNPGSCRCRHRLHHFDASAFVCCKS